MHDTTGLAVTHGTTSRACQALKNGGNTATSYHGLDNEDDDDLSYDDDHNDDGNDDGYDDDDDCSVFEAASRISPVQELQMTTVALTGIIPQLAHHTWIICLNNCQNFPISITFILEENIASVQTKKVAHIMRYHW